ncbi:MAG: hypothetical protein ABIH42_07645 [Planctomycetota bacterium]
MSKKKILLSVSCCLAIFLFFSSLGECAEVPADLSHLLDPLCCYTAVKSNRGKLCFQDRELVEESYKKVEIRPHSEDPEKQYTERRTSRYEIPNEKYGAYQSETLLGFRIGLLVPAHSRLTKTPDNSGLLGLDLRFPVSPYGAGKIEISCDFNISGMDVKYAASKYDTVYEDYVDAILSYLGTFSADPTVSSPVYWGIGVGWGREIVRYNPIDGTGCYKFTNDTTILQLKLGWDSGQGYFIEACFKELLDSDRNVENMWGLVIGFVR